MVPQWRSRRRRQPFKTAMACSPTPRILTWLLLRRRFQCLSRRPRKGTRMCRPAPWYALSAQHFSPRGGECVDDPALAGSGQVLGGAWQGRGSPQQSAECEDLNVHAAPFVFARVARYFDGDLVDRQQCAVQDDARLGCGDLPLGQGRDAGGQDLNGLTSGRARDLTGRFGMPNSPVPSKRWRADRSRM